MRLIDADALLMNMNLAIAILEGTMKNLGLQDDAECQMELKAYRDIRDGIKDEPTIEPITVEEHGKGHWLRYGEDGYPNNEDTVFWQCDQCLEQYTERAKKIPNFCPNCGADMRPQKGVTDV